MLFVMWQTTFISIGIYVMVEDHSLKSQKLCEDSHVWRYICFNVVFAFLLGISYFLFPGGGEGARARAMVCLVIHFGFTVWGILQWTALTDACAHLLDTQYKTLYEFQHICVVTNFVFFGFFVVHEAYLGHKLGLDFTLMSEIYRHNTQPPYSQFPAGTPVPATPVSGSTVAKFPPHAPGHLAHDEMHAEKTEHTTHSPLNEEDPLAKEYETIMGSKQPVHPIQLRTAP